MKISTTAEKIDWADIDRHFGKFIARFGGDSELVETSAALLSQSVRQGHVCLDLADPIADSPNELELLAPTEWGRRLGESPAFGPPEALTPIVVAGDRIFLRRYWDYHQMLAAAIVSRAKRNAARDVTASTQDEAIDAALRNHFTIISGGPGTGKTTTVLGILKRFIENHSDRRLRVALAAPTGKAAARLQELLRQMQDDCDSRVKELLPRNASTIHRLLGVKPNSVYFRHDARNPLPLDLLIVDEASMVDLPIMAKLLDALPPAARVILVGDRDQLASVQPGSVLADLADAASDRTGPLQNALIVLSKNYRFGNKNAIYRFSNAVRAGKGDEVLRILGEKNLAEFGGSTTPSPAQLAARLEKLAVEEYRALLLEKDPVKALAGFDRFRVLCALREGPFGVNQVNESIEGSLRRHGLIPDSTGFYRGMPILVTRNDYQSNLFNGDIGIILPDPSEGEGDQLWAWFIGADNHPRRISPGRLPEHELAYAMTVHKAQGSQFERVLLILPDRDSPVLTRELIYTGLTRASQRVDLWSNEGVVRASIDRQAVRRSGLRDLLVPKRPLREVQGTLPL